MDVGFYVREDVNFGKKKFGDTKGVIQRRTDNTIQMKKNKMTNNVLKKTETKH
jgi:hypothetical protein